MAWKLGSLLDRLMQPRRRMSAAPFGPGRGPFSDFELKDYILAPHRRFQGGIDWALTSTGVSVNKNLPARTPGDPTTVLRILDWFGHDIADAAKEFAVPLELIVATIGAEVGTGIQEGWEQAIDSERKEPGFVSYSETPARVSVGLMQTLISTARETLEDQEINEVSLRNPKVSIRAGTAYIKREFSVTDFDPPVVACAYNSGGVYEDTTPTNRWQMKHTQGHAGRFVLFFNDVMALPEMVSALAAPSFTLRFRHT